MTTQESGKTCKEEEDVDLKPSSGVLQSPQSDQEDIPQPCSPGDATNDYQLHENIPKPNSPSVGNELFKASKEAKKSGKADEKDCRRSTFWYFTVYAVGYFVGGACSAASVIMLTRLQEQLNVSTSQVSLIYTFTFVGSITGSIFSGIALDWGCIAKYSHFYCAFVMLLNLISMLLLKSVTSLMVMIIIWFVFGNMIGMTETVSVVYIYRVWKLTGNVMFGKIELFFSISGALVSIIIEMIDNNLFWYIMASLSAIYVILIVILATPSQSDLVDAITEQVIEEVMHYNATRCEPLHAIIESPNVMQATKTVTSLQHSNADQSPGKNLRSQVSSSTVFMYKHPSHTILSTKVNNTIASNKQDANKSNTEATSIAMHQKFKSKTKSLINLPRVASIEVDPRGSFEPTSMMSLAMEMEHARREAGTRVNQILTKAWENANSNNINVETKQNENQSTLPSLQNVEDENEQLPQTLLRLPSNLLSLVTTTAGARGDASGSNTNANSNEVLNDAELEYLQWTQKDMQNWFDIETNLKRMISQTNVSNYNNNSIFQNNAADNVLQTRLEHNLSSLILQNVTPTLPTTKNNSSNSNKRALMKSEHPNENLNEMVEYNNNPPIAKAPSVVQELIQMGPTKNSLRIAGSSVPEQASVNITDVHVVAMELNQIKYFKKVFIICLINVSTIKFFFHAFISAFLPYYASNYLNWTNETKAETILAFYYWVFLLGKIIAPIALQYVNHISLCWIYFVLPFICSIAFLILQIAFENDYDSSTFFIGLIVIYCGFAVCVAASFSTLFAVCDSIQPITAFVGTCIVLTFGAGNAAGGYGGALVFEMFGFGAMPMLAVVSSMLQLILVIVQVVMFHKIKKSEA